jgi:hypothetical protein
MKGGGDLKLDLRSNLSGLGLDKWREILAGLFSRAFANGKKKSYQLLPWIIIVNVMRWEIIFAELWACTTCGPFNTSQIGTISSKKK